MSNEKPKRKIHVKIEIFADDFEALKNEFENISLCKIQENNYQSSSFSGGVSASSLYNCVINSEQTAENYQRELKEYVEGIK